MAFLKSLLTPCDFFLSRIVPKMKFINQNQRPLRNLKINFHDVLGTAKERCGRVINTPASHLGGLLNPETGYPD
jgi:hypothetical protein